jgi:hypothetical protein
VYIPTFWTGQLNWYSDSKRNERFGIKSQMGRDLPHSCGPALGPTQPPIQWVPGHLRMYNSRNVALTTPTPSSVEVKERVDV